jgi:hypothetical protein
MPRMAIGSNSKAKSYGSLYLQFVMLLRASAPRSNRYCEIQVFSLEMLDLPCTIPYAYSYSHPRQALSV